MPGPKNPQCCDPCRVLHHKCDGVLPQCGRCARTSRECTRGKRETKFRQAKGRASRTKFPQNQVWLRPPPRVDFVLESGSGEPDDLTEREANHSPERGAQSIPSPERPSSRSSYAAIIPSYEHTAHQLPSSGRSSIIPGPDTPEQQHERRWPLRDPEEARLLQHFVNNVAPFFDCTDRQQHFAIHIPHRARRCETLFNAIMAMSARHLNRTTKFDPFVSDHYYQACLEKLIPALDNHGVTMDDDLLAATVILRLLEEFDVPLAGSDIRGHSFGTKAFIRGPTLKTTTPSLRQAVYWSGLRQEIYNALSLQQAPDIDLSSLNLNSEFSPLGPDAEGHRSTAVHAELKAQNEQWTETRPDSFDPFFVGEEVEIGTAFPDIRFGCPWHAIGNQYTDLARILLAVHDPSLPTVGPLRRRLIREADDLIRKGVWTRWWSGAWLFIFVSMMITRGDRFTDPQQQDLLIQVLVRTDTLHGWPTHALQRQLRETWGIH
ncbi:transcriptional regulator family: Fungal Specific TF [Penicillium brevicompactum]|uniref:Transcriptional regulator family: Fungal Specific TF n=1 Tax=Penicillium brevicompactum TaxID=5074 RepID=A0A9W9UIT6_PENBR|nr:transcriptional regulator family: Fungal Specific TF [Penicillium brevicompactum]